MELSRLYFEKSFTSPSSKTAYLKAFKWLAKHIVSKTETGDPMGETTTHIIKSYDNETGFPVFTVKLYCSLSEKEFRKNYCDKCRSHHRNVFHNQFFHCDKCQLKAYLTSMEKKLEEKAVYRKKKLHAKLRLKNE